MLGLPVGVEEGVLVIVVMTVAVDILFCLFLISTVWGLVVGISSERVLMVLLGARQVDQGASRLEKLRRWR